MSKTISFFSVTARACSTATALYFQPFLSLRSIPRQPKFSLEPKRPQNRIDSLLGDGMRFVGDVSCERKGIRIDGQWVGNVICEKGTVVISPTGLLEGNLSTAFAVIDGYVKGNIIASCAVEIQSHARIEGSVSAPVVEVNSGAMVRGQIETTETLGSATFHELRGTVREIADEVTKIHRVK